MIRKCFRAATMVVLAALTVAACSSGRSGTNRSSPAAKAGAPSSVDVTPAAHGGAFCDVVRMSRDAMRPLSEDLLRHPANTEGSWDGLVKQWQAMAAAAPPELRGDLRAIVDSWNRAGDEAAKGGWDALSLTRALATQMNDAGFQRAYEHWAGYIHDNCGIEPFNPAQPA
jgi:hypothetical protein